MLHLLPQLLNMACCKQSCIQHVGVCILPNLEVSVAMFRSFDMLLMLSCHTPCSINGYCHNVLLQGEVTILEVQDHPAGHTLARPTWYRQLH